MKIKAYVGYSVFASIKLILLHNHVMGMQCAQCLINKKENVSQI